MSGREQQVFQAVADQCRHDVDYFCSTGAEESAVSLTSGWSLHDNMPMMVRWIRAPEQDDEQVTPDRRVEEQEEEADLMPSLEQHLDEMSRLIDSFFSQAFNDLNAFEELPGMTTPTTTTHHAVYMVLDNNQDDYETENERRRSPATSNQDLAEPSVPDRLVQHIAEQSPPSLLQDVSRLMQERGHAILQQQQELKQQQQPQQQPSSTTSSSETRLMPNHPMLRRIEFEEPLFVRCARRLTEVTPEELARWHSEPKPAPPAQQQVFLPFGSQNACLQRAYQQGAVSMPCGSAVQALERLRTRQVEEQASYRQEQHFFMMHLAVFCGLVWATTVIVGYQRYVRQQAILDSRQTQSMQQKRALKRRILRAVYSRPSIKAAIEHEIQQPMGRVPPVSWEGLQRTMNPNTSNNNDPSLPQGRRLVVRKMITSFVFYCAMMSFVSTASPVMVLQVMVFLSAILFVGVALSCCCAGTGRNGWENNMMMNEDPMCTCCCCGATTSTPDYLLTEAMQCCSCCMGTGVCSVACANCCSGGSDCCCCCCGGKGCCCCNGSCCGPKGGCCGKSTACCQGACCDSTGCCCCAGGTNCGDDCCCTKTTTAKKMTQKVRLDVYEGVPVQIV